MAESLVRRLQMLKQAQDAGTLRMRVGPDAGRAAPADMSPEEALVLGYAPPPEPSTDARTLSRQQEHQQAVDDAGDDFSQRITQAAQNLKKTMDSRAAKGQTVSLADDESIDPALITPFNNLIQYVQTVGNNAKDGGDTVVEPVARALATLDPAIRGMVLRRAGNPAVFADLPALADPPAAPSMADLVRAERAKGRVKAEDKKIAAKNAVSALPMIQRPSSVFQGPDQIITKGPKKGKIKPSADTWENHAMRDLSPMDVDSTKAPSSQRRALNALAGNQIAQIRKIQQRILAENGYTADDIAEMPKETREALYAQFFPEPTFARPGETDPLKGVRGPLPDALLPQYVTPRDAPPVLKRTEAQPSRRLTPGQSRALELAGEKDRTVEELSKAAEVSSDSVRRLVKRKLLDYSGQIREQSGDHTMWAGTRGDAPTANREMERRSRSTFTKLLEELDRAAEKKGAIDLDTRYPWWRGRFGELDDKGQLAYPPRMPSAEFIAGMIQGQLGVTDPDFMRKMVPVIQRSIDAAPDTPAVPDPKDRSRKGRSAYEYSQSVFLPSEQFLDAMQGGVGSKDYPYKIYGDRIIPAAEVTAPDRHPFRTASESPSADAGVDEFRQLQQGGMQASEPSSADADVEEYHRLLGDGPGLSDQSSIYRVRPASPLRSLIA